MKKLFGSFGLLFVLSQSVLATPIKAPLTAPQPTTCIVGTFTASGDAYWKAMVLKLTNNCGKTVDFQNSSVTFQTKSALNTSFWGDFAPLAYPDNNLQITSQSQTGGMYLATLNLHFPETSWSNTKLPAGNSIYIKYGTSSADQVANSVQVYLNNAVVDSGNIKLTNLAAKPANVSQSYAIVHVSLNGQDVSLVQLPWSGTQTVSGLSVGTYGISAENVTDSNGLVYQGSANPSTIQLTAGQTVESKINYAQVAQAAKINVALQALPSQLAGYIGKPIVQLIQGGTSVPLTVNWGATTTASSLKSGASYTFSTPTINYNGYDCKPAFNPTSLVAIETNAPTTNLSYQCTQVAKSIVTLNVSGAPASLTSLKINLTPNDGSASVSQNVTLSNGRGTATVSLTTGTIYQLSSDSVPGYSVNFNPNPVTANPNTSVTVTLSTGTPISVNGQLKVCGTKLCNQNGVPIQLRGMSTHGLQWYGLNVCLTQASLDALAYDFRADVIRISLYVQEGGYDTDPVGFTRQVNQLIEEATKRGMYALVDWHQLDPGDPNYNLEKAKKFFTDIATANKGKTNLIYDIANEPNGVAWSAIKTYADKLIPVIRAIDPNTVILVGTHGWSSLGISDGRTYQDIVNQPVNAQNIMYTFHFYAASHKDEYLNALDKASNVLPIFVTEFGTQTYTGDGANDFAMSDRYMQLMNSKKISWTNWNYSDDFRSGAIWKTGTCSGGPWTDANLKPAGVWVKNNIKNR